MNNRESKYILYGTDNLSRDAMAFFGRESIAAFFDPAYEDGDIDGITVITDENQFKNCSKNKQVVLTWSGIKNITDAVELMCRLGVRYKLFGEAASEVIDDEAVKYSEMNIRPVFAFDDSRKHYFARDRVSRAGSVNHYFWQDLWAAKHIYKHRPETHYDIGSRVDGFIANVLSFGQKVNLIDVRPLDVNIPGVSFTRADATHLDGIDDGSIQSLSALCSLEHFGLGRYGDPLDPEACFKCFDAIQNKVDAGGHIYIAVPVGKEGVEFNAHRVFSPNTIINEFSRCILKEYAVDFGTHIEYGVDYNELNEAKDYEYGLFYFVKKG
ncbi:MAG: DUF268 domain-containing protein [Lachnospiraceae bacterium]|nr:DUF268 domain-containing protein [Lachnospiraceae bacterium]